MASQIEELMQQIRLLCTEKGWRNEHSGTRSGHEFGAYIALGHSEFSEALDAYRDQIWSDTRPLQQGETIPKPVGVGPELADTLIRVLDMCDIWKIDIEYEISRVMEYGWTRPYKHGGRAL